MRGRAPSCKAVAGLLALAALSSGAVTGQRSGAGASGSAPTWVDDVAPLVFESCVACHRDGGSAPFVLTGYEDVRRRARQIAEVTRSRFMPPWLPAPGALAFADERRLDEREIDLLERWWQAGAPRGTGSQPPVPTAPDGWQLGAPDLVVEMPERYVLPADGVEVFRNFVLPLDLDARRWVRAVELSFDNPAVVHHAILTVDESDASRRLDGEDGQPGFDGMRALSRRLSPGGQFVSWTPGKVPSAGDGTMAWPLSAGSDLVLEAHLLPTGRSEAFAARAGIHFAEGPPSRQPVVLRLGSKTIDIAAGAHRHVVEDRLVLPVDVELLSIYPHAHYLCRSMEARAVLPGGGLLELLSIPEWDFNWQDLYRFAEPRRLVAGTELVMRYTYDNSAGNVRNPHSPPMRVVYGPSSFDEMGDLWIQVVPTDVKSLFRLQDTLARRERQALVDGHRKRLVDDPEDPETRFNLARELLGTGRADGADEAAALLGRLVSESPSSARAHLNLGNALSLLGRQEDAVAHFRSAAALAPDRAEMHFNLANGLAQSRPEEALAAYDRSLELRPAMAAAHVNRSRTLDRLGRPVEARSALEAALAASPGYPPAVYNLALAARRSGDSELALETIDRGLAVDPWSPRLLSARGDALVDLGSLEDAGQAYRTALEVDSSSIEASIGLALVELRTGSRTAGVARLEAVLERLPGHPEATVLLRSVR